MLLHGLTTAMHLRELSLIVLPQIKQPEIDTNAVGSSGDAAGVKTRDLNVYFIARKRAFDYMCYTAKNIFTNIWSGC